MALGGAGGWYAVNPVTEDFTDKQPTQNIDSEIVIIVGGDVNMGRQTGQKILAGEIDYPFLNIAEVLKSADIAFVNLESQLADLNGETQSPTNEYRFAGPPEGAQSLANAGIDIVSVANNHMWDYGKARLEETLTNLNNAGVIYVGANMDPTQVWTPKIIEVKGKNVAFQNGSRLVAEIQKIKDEVDWVIISLHSGAEYTANPSSAMVQMSHDLIDAGADAILAGHPHVPQRIEEYTAGSSSPSFTKVSEGEGIKNQSKGIIFYSLGNFAFWQPFDFWPN